jgi:predicted esterase
MPQHPVGQKLSAILFLHGFGGNYTSFLYKLSYVADICHVAIVAPSYKAGAWDVQAVNFVDYVIQDAEKKFDVAPNGYYLLGFSNGGLITPAMYDHDPTRY